MSVWKLVCVWSNWGLWLLKVEVSKQFLLLEVVHEGKFGFVIGTLIDLAGLHDVALVVDGMGVCQV